MSSLIIIRLKPGFGIYHENGLKPHSYSNLFLEWVKATFQFSNFLKIELPPDSSGGIQLFITWL
ncbi:hypothetical protein [Peijinzhouia sedimentorum]